MKFSERVEADVSEDLENGVPQSTLHNKSQEVKALRKKLVWRVFHVRYLLGRVQIDSDVESQGYHTSDEWYRRLEIYNINEADIQKIKELIDEHKFSLAVVEHLESNGRYAVEIV